MLIDVASIKIPYMFRITPPRAEKLERHIKYYEEHNHIMKSIILTEKLMIRDGYADYLTALKYGIEQIDCEICVHKEARKSSQRRRNIRKKLYVNQDGLCSICGKPLQIEKFNYDDFMTIDHIVPISLGGSTEFENLQGACYKCNLEKGNTVDLKIYENYLQKHKQYDASEVQLIISSIKERNGFTLTKNLQKKVSMCW